MSNREIVALKAGMMDWKDLLKGDALPWLLEESDPGVRYLALRDLLDLEESDPELVKARGQAHKHGPIAKIMENMQSSGYWAEPGPGYLPKYRSTVWSIILLAQLGASVEVDPRIRIACNYYLEESLAKGGQIASATVPSGSVPCLQGNICWALPELGFQDLRLDMAFEWMARTITGEGIAPMEDKHAEVRYYAGTCGPTFRCGANNKLPCAWGAAKVMLAFGNLPLKKRTPVIQRATEHGAEFLLSIDPATAEYPTGNNNKPSQNWWKFGFPVFYVTDLVQIVEGLANLGYGKDPRLENAIKLILEKQDKNGRWLLEYDYAGKTWSDFGEKKQPNKWVTLRAYRVLKKIEEPAENI